MDRLQVYVVVLDNDGVVVDSFTAIVQKHQRCARQLGLRVPDVEEMRLHTGKHWAEGFLPALWPEDHDRIRVALLQPHERSVYPTFPGFVEYLEGLYRAGIPLAIVSNREAESLYFHLQEANVQREWFSIIQTADDTPFRKPDPRVFDAVREKYPELERSAFVYVGDTLEDWHAAHGAGFHFIAVTTGPTTREEFLNVGIAPQYILSSPSALPNVLEPIPKNRPHLL